MRKEEVPMFMRRKKYMVDFVFETILAIVLVGFCGFGCILISLLLL